MSRKVMDPIEEEDTNKRMKSEMHGNMKIKGTVVLMKKNLFELNDTVASVRDRFDEILGHKVSLQLISAVSSDSNGNELRGKLGKPAFLEDWSKITPLTASEVSFNVTFDWDEENIGVPRAFLIKNNHHNEFYLKTLTLEDVPGHGQIHFICNSWVYPAKYYKRDRFLHQSALSVPR